VSIKVMKFGAEWCPPCHMLDRTVDRLKNDMPDVEWVSINIDDEPELATEYEIKAVPTLIFFKDGARKFSMAGLYSYEAIKNRLEDLK